MSIQNLQLNSQTSNFNEEKEFREVNIDDSSQIKYLPLQDKINTTEEINQLKDNNKIDELQLNSSAAQENESNTKTIIKMLQIIIKVVIFSKKSIRLIYQYSMLYRFKLLKLMQFNLISDQASYPKYYQFNHQLVSIKMSAYEQFKYKLKLNLHKNAFLKCFIDNWLAKKINSIASNFVVIHPEQNFRFIWDVIFMLLLILNIFYLPLYFGFHSEQDPHSINLPNELLLFFEYIPGYAFLIDIIMNINTGFYFRGKLITNKKKIFINYAKGYLVLDLIIFIIFIISIQCHQKYLTLVLFLRANKILLILTKLQDMIDFKETAQAAYELIKLIILILFIAHICGCILFFISHELYYNGYPGGWIDKFQLIDKDWPERYVTSLYWAVITMITIGYGDYYPILVVEKISSIVIALISCGIFAYSISKIGTIVDQLNKRDREFSDQMKYLKRYLKLRGLDNDSYHEIYRYFHYIHDERIEELEISEQLMSQLTKRQLGNVKQDIYFNYLNKQNQISRNFSTEFLKELSLHLKELRFSPEEMICQKGEISNRFYIIIKGQIKSLIFINSQQKLVRTFNDRQIVSFQSFLTQQASETNLMSSQYTQVIYCEYGEFMKILKQFPEDNEKYNYLKDQINIEKNMKLGCVKCESCGHPSHKFEQCPFLKININRNRIIAQANKHAIVEDRIMFTRRFQRAQPSLSIVQSLKEIAIIFSIECLKLDSSELKEIFQNIEETDQSEDLTKGISKSNNIILASSLIDSSPQKIIPNIEINRLASEDINYNLLSPELKKQSLSMLQRSGKFKMEFQKNEKTQDRTSLKSSLLKRRQGKLNQQVVKSYCSIDTSHISRKIQSKDTVREKAVEYMQNKQYLSRTFINLQEFQNPLLIEEEDESLDSKLRQLFLNYTSQNHKSSGQFSCINFFDQSKIFTFYYSHNNVNLVLREVNQTTKKISRSISESSNIQRELFQKISIFKRAALQKLDKKKKFNQDKAFNQ